MTKAVKAERPAASLAREIGADLNAGKISEEKAKELLAALYEKQQGGAPGRQNAAQRRYAERRQIVAPRLRDVSEKRKTITDVLRERLGVKGDVREPVEMVVVVNVPHSMPGRWTAAEHDIAVVGDAVYARTRTGESVHQFHVSQVLLRW